MSQQLIQRWEKRIKSAKRQSAIAKIRIFLTFAILPIQLLFSVNDAFETIFGAFVFITTVIIFIVALMVFIRGLRKYDNIGSWPNLKAASSATTAEIDKVLLPLTTEMGIDRAKLNLLVDSKGFGSAPSMIESRDGQNVNVVMPIGYLKMLKAHPNVAKAILAHELSHVRQEDTRLWLLVTAYGRSLLRVLVPFSVFMFVVSFIYSCSAINSAGLDEWPLEVKTALVRQFGGIALLLAFYYSVTKMRRKSESTADLGAAAFAGIENVKSALTPYLGLNIEGPFAMHPSADERVNALAKLEPGSVPAVSAKVGSTT